MVARNVTFTVTIKNQGHAESDVSTIYFYIDTLRYYDSIESINPGATVTETFSWTALAGSHTVKAIADAENSVIEGNESNNVKTTTISPLLPDPSDLVVQSIVWSPENPGPLTLARVSGARPSTIMGSPTLRSVWWYVPACIPRKAVAL